MASSMMPDDLLESAARRFKLLSEPVRLRVLNGLQVHGELSVQELVRFTGERQATVSKHLSYLYQEGMLGRRKDGQRVFYRIEDPTISAICMLVCARVREQRELHELSTAG